METWYRSARERKLQRNPDAMTVATIDPDGRPSARVVLCKAVEADPGCVVFYTNKRSRKGRALEANPRAAVVLHWDAVERQIRLEGPVVPTGEAENDAYFASRHPASRVGAWASDQSEPIESRDALMEKVAERVMGLGLDLDNAENPDIPRPPHWGGYRVWADTVELWIGSPARVHDRAVWTRDLEPRAGTFTPGPWSATRLQP